jgi:hypothetical protein
MQLGEKGVTPLDENGLILREALMDDIAAIWSLLHAAQIPWSDGQIAGQLSQLYVLIHNKKMLGVLWGLNHEARQPEWIVIHPMYPEKPFQDMMREGWRCLSYKS